MSEPTNSTGTAQSVGSRVKSYPKPLADPKTQARPEPDFSAGAAEKFPIDAFPPRLRAMADNLAQVYQTPVCMPAMSALAVLSGAVGKSVIVQRAYKDKSTRLNVYVVAAAERGTGKGNIGEVLASPISARSRELAERHRRHASDRKAELGLRRREIQRAEQAAFTSKGPERDNQMETLKNHQNSADYLEAEANRKVTLWVADCTSQKLAVALADNGEAVFSYSAEAGGVLKVVLGRYNDGKGDFDFYLSAYSGDGVRVDRIGRPSLELLSPCLSLLWLVQGSVLRELCADAEAFSRGLTARILIFDTSAQRVHDDRQFLAFAHRDEWRSFIDKVIDHRLSDADPRKITCSPEAREVFAKFDDESVDLERGPFSDLKGELSRWRENAIKVAGLFAVAEGLDSISSDLAARAVAVVRWCGFSYLGLLQSGRRERLRDDLERIFAVLRQHGGEINLGTLVRNHGIGRALVESVLAAYPDRLTIERRQQQRAGRPAEVLRAADKSTFSNRLANGGKKVDLVDLSGGGGSR